eukprot:TRINITY_DN8686_c0_g1_i3.p1 TRINITY_DN8686_c0_g1~~TRINITY_DN8686_c0_g1_i3.p1  ORF type:complete len:813 (-),score=196.53 TRINITY_DN8686_c0_g1_i3:993-3431(-)
MGRETVIPWFVHLVVLGEVGVGKTSFINSYLSGNSSHQMSSPSTGIERHQFVSKKGNTVINCVIWDVDSSATLEKVRTLLDQAHTVFLCFNVGDKSSLISIREKWSQEVADRQEKVRFILIGLQSDRRKSDNNLNTESVSGKVDGAPTIHQQKSSHETPSVPIGGSLEQMICVTSTTLSTGQEGEQQKSLKGDLQVDQQHFTERQKEKTEQGTQTGRQQDRKWIEQSVEGGGEGKQEEKHEQKIDQSNQQLKIQTEIVSVPLRELEVRAETHPKIQPDPRKETPTENQKEIQPETQPKIQLQELETQLEIHPEAPLEEPEPKVQLEELEIQPRVQLQELVTQLEKQSKVRSKEIETQPPKVQMEERVQPEELKTQQVQLELELETQQQVQMESELETQIETKIEKETKTQPEVQLEAGLENRTKIETQSEIQTKPKLKELTEPELQIEVQKETQTEIQWKKQPEAQIEIPSTCPEIQPETILSKSQNQLSNQEKQNLISLYDISLVAEQIGLVDYIERSTVENQGIGILFETVLNGIALEFQNSVEKELFVKGDEEINGILNNVTHLNPSINDLLKDTEMLNWMCKFIDFDMDKTMNYFCNEEKLYDIITLMVSVELKDSNARLAFWKLFNSTNDRFLTTLVKSHRCLSLLFELMLDEHYGIKHRVQVVALLQTLCTHRPKPFLAFFSTLKIFESGLHKLSPIYFLLLPSILTEEQKYSYEVSLLGEDQMWEFMSLSLDQMMTSPNFLPRLISFYLMIYQVREDLCRLFIQFQECLFFKRLLGSLAHTDLLLYWLPFFDDFMRVCLVFFSFW